MKNATIFSVIFFFLSFNFAFGQENIERIIPYNTEIGDWDIVFTLPVDVKVAPEFGAKIVIISSGWEEFPAQITDRGIEFIHPTYIHFHQNRTYTFRTIVYDEHGRGYVSEPEFISAPTFESMLEYKISGNTVDLKLVCKNQLGLTPSLNYSEFSIVPNDKDSIIYGFYQRKMFDFATNESLMGSIEIHQSDIKEKIISYFVTMENQFGIPRLLDVTSKFLLIDGLKGNLKITHNLTGVGTITPYFDNNQPKEAFIVTSSGMVIKKISVVSGESFWPGTEIPAGMYYLHVPGIGTQPFIKAVSE